MTTQPTSGPPTWVYKSIRGEERTERFQFVKNFLNSENAQHFQIRQDCLKKIEDGEYRCRVVYAENDLSQPLGLFIYEERAKDSYSALDFKKALEIPVFFLFSNRIHSSHLPSCASQMIDEIIDMSKHLRPQSFVIAIHKTENCVANILKTINFQLAANQNSDFKVWGRQIGLPGKRKAIELNKESSSRLNKEETEEKRTEENGPLHKTQRSKSETGHEPKRAKVYQHTHSYTQKPLGVTLKKKYIHDIQSKIKTIEGRINNGMFKNLTPGRLIRFFYFQDNTDDVTCEITHVNKYSSFRDMILHENFKACVPEAKSQAEAIQIYDSIPGYADKAREHGVLAIHLKKVDKSK